MWALSLQKKHIDCQKELAAALRKMENTSGLHRKLRDGLTRRKRQAVIIRSTRAKQLGSLFTK